jgi:glyoxylase-like metal-dependent hydrolase (beta-lactamase superfamily II)
MRLSANLWRVEDSCNVYVVGGPEPVCVDFGTGLALDARPLRGAGGPAHVLMTHHHRDQGQGLPLAAAAGARIWAPHQEQDLFAAVDAHWQAREIANNYNTRQDRFSLLEPVPLAGTLRDYATYEFGGRRFEVLPTPGHTVGSLSLLSVIDGRLVAFTGDLIAGPGQLWSLAATQWSYSGGEGLVATILSLLALKERRPELLLPSHGPPIAAVDEAIDLTVERLLELVRLRGHNPRLLQFREQPYLPVSEHLLWNRTSMAYSYVLRSRSGQAMLFDFGYDFIPGAAIAAGSDRAARRPWLYTLPALKDQFGVRAIGAVVPTHAHDDHVAGLNLLRDVEGAEVWAAEAYADILQNPHNYDLPCLWHDPIAVDRVLPLEQPISWEEHTLTLHALPGHARHAVAISLEVDGRRVLIAGDQHGGDGVTANYVYQNGFGVDDYRASAALYRRLAPDLILSGHFPPQETGPGFFEELERRGESLARLHRALLPARSPDPVAAELVARIRPYVTVAKPGRPVELRVTVRNPGDKPAWAEVVLTTPPGWEPAAPRGAILLPPGDEGCVDFRITPHGQPARRARVAADVTIDGRPLGQQAEALISTG